jgi:hypothetical protein
LWSFTDIVRRGSCAGPVSLVEKSGRRKRERGDYNIASFSNHCTLAYWQTWRRPSNPLKSSPGVQTNPLRSA